MPAETEAVEHCYLDLMIAGMVGNVIQITALVCCIQIDRRMNLAGGYALGTDDHRQPTTGAKRVAGHALGRIDWHLVSMSAQDALDRHRFAQITQRCAGGMSIDV